MSETPEDNYEYRAFHPDQIFAYDEAVITVKVHTMAGSFYVEWEFVRHEGSQIIGRRMKRGQ